MSEIKRAFALSDLHLGNPLSYLNAETPEFLKNLQATGDLLNSLGTADELILNGDIFELALAGHDVICRDARAFFQLLAELNRFPKIILIPGNHDHHLWFTLAEQVHVHDKIKTGQTPPGHTHYPGCFVDKRFSSTDLNNPCDLPLHYFWPQGKPVPEFIVKYPHHLVRIPQKNGELAPFLVTHGHYLENRFIPVNYLVDPAHLEELEAFNNFWLESFDYHWGHAGRLSEKVRKIDEGYRRGEEEARIAALQVLDEIYANLRKKLRLNWFHAMLLKWGLRFFVKKMPLKCDSPLRNQPIDAELKHQIREYISRYVIERYRAGKANVYFFPGSGNIPQPFTFVFGHTHRPVAGPDSPVITINHQKYPLVNTGGWLRLAERGAVPGATAGVLIIDENGASWKSLAGKLV